MFATLNFSDIFKSSFMENISAFSVLDTIIALTLAFVIGLFIMAVYKKTFKGVMYSHSFCVSLLALNLITTLIIFSDYIKRYFITRDGRGVINRSF